MGMSLYGRGFVLDNAASTGFYAPAALPIPDGPYTQQNGTWSYLEVKRKFCIYLDRTKFIIFTILY